MHARQPQMPDRPAERTGSNRAHSVLCAPLAQIKDFTSKIYSLATGRVPASRDSGSCTYMMLSLIARRANHLVRMRSHCWTTCRRQAGRGKAIVATDGVCYPEPHLRNLQILLNQDILLGHRWWCRIGRPYRHAQDRLLWRDKTCPAHT